MATETVLSDKKSLAVQIAKIQSEYEIIGRTRELKLLLIGIKAKKNIILEGAVGTGKTYLARAISHHVNSDFIRIDGSEDVLSHVLVGYFDPPVVISKGYSEESFIYGPLSNAMEAGGVLFINELNRIPESTQNVLLSALDEHNIIIPKLKTLEAKEGFITIATQNPSAHVGVSALGEALKDRFIWINIEYQTEPEEKEIVRQNLGKIKHKELITTISVQITRATREHPDVRRGASIRGALDLAQLVAAYGNKPSYGLWVETTVMALHSKIELMDGIDRNAREVLEEIVESILENFM